MSLSRELSNWIRDSVQSAGAEGVVVGLSGGLDSAVVAALSKRALGDQVLGVVMPCHSSPTDEEDVVLLCAAFKIRTEKIGLDSAYDGLLDILPQGNAMSRSNLKPRLRMLVLYYFANKLNYLVIGTGNKSEIMVGYFTKHGDGAADLLPLGGLLKYQVVELANELGIPPKIVKKIPSAGLWEGQTDESELGISYAQLDKALSAIESGVLAEADPEVLVRVRKLIEGSKHKRNPIPIPEQ